MTDQEMIELAQALVRIPSVSGEEREVAAYLAGRIKSTFDNVRVDDHNNVIAELAGDRPGPTILLNGHLDVVDAGEMVDPWSGKLVNGARWGSPGMVLWGRGSSDMKGPLTALVAAADSAGRRGFAGRVVLTAVIQEEPGQGVGTLQATAALGCRPDIAILAEPTDFEICLGHRGKVEFELETHGRTAHSSIPSTGVNALLLMNAFLNAWPELPMPEHPLAGRCTSAITNITVSPGRLAVIPDRCRLHFDVRFLPGESHERPVSDVRRLLERLAATVPDFQYELRQRVVMPSYLMPPDWPAVELLADVVESVIGRVPRRCCYTAGTDGTYLWNEFGIPVLGCGPGRIDEWLLPVTMYGCNKLYCEHLGRYFARHYRQLAAQSELSGVDFRAIRFPGLISAATVPSGGTSDYAPEMIHAAAQGRPYACFVKKRIWSEMVCIRADEGEFWARVPITHKD